MKTKQNLSLLLTALLVASLAGCNSGQSAKTALPERIEELSFPYAEETVTLSIFMSLDSKTAATKTSYEEVEAYQKVEELTNVDIEWQHPPVGQEAEQFNLMMASGDLADIVHYDWTQYPGGATKAMSENLILDLTDLVSRYAPNLRAYLDSNPEEARSAKTDDGKLPTFPYGCLEIYQRATELKPAFYTFGWQIRKDWLEKLDLEIPETLSEWHQVLTAFKTQDPNGNGKADEIPLIHTKNDVSYWLRAWGLNYDFCVADGVVKYGPYEPEFEAFLTTMNQWYSEGLLDPDYVTNDGKQFDSKVSGSLAGAWTGATSGTLGRFVQLMADKEPDAEITGTVQPYVDGGTPYNFDSSSFFPISSIGAAISAKCETPEIAAMLLDFGYSDQGDALYNWGIEGKSYTIDEEGNYLLTEEITHNPEGLSLDQALAQYAPGANGGFFFASNSLWNQRMWMPEQQEAISRWSVGSGERILPPGISLTTEESQEAAAMLSAINTYRDEMLNKFIMGVELLSGYPAFRDQLKTLGIERVLEIYQAAYDRYRNR